MTAARAELAERATRRARSCIFAVMFYLFLRSRLESGCVYGKGKIRMRLSRFEGRGIWKIKRAEATLYLLSTLPIGAGYILDEPGHTQPFVAMPNC